MQLNPSLDFEFERHQHDDLVTWADLLSSMVALLMVATLFAGSSGMIPVKSESAPAETKPEIVIEVAADNHIEVAGKPVTIESLTGLTGPILVKLGPHVLAEHAGRIQAALRNADSVSILLP